MVAAAPTLPGKGAHCSPPPPGQAARGTQGDTHKVLHNPGDTRLASTAPRPFALCVGMLERHWAQPAWHSRLRGLGDPPLRPAQLQVW